MTDNSRRDFLKKAGAGVGLVVASGLWSNSLFTACTPKGEFDMNEGYFGFTKEDLKKLLAAALSKGGDFADLYFEHRVFNSVNMSEDIIKSSSESVSLGVGIRVIKNKQTGYGYTNELTFDSIKNAAMTAAAIASGNSKVNIADMEEIKPNIEVYDLKKPYADAKLEEKIKIIKEAYKSAQKYDNKITKVSASIADSLQRITIVNSEGLIVSDERPQMRLRVTSTANFKGKRATGNNSDGGRIGMDFKGFKTPEEVGKLASEEAMILLDAVNPPTGEQPVVLKYGQSGVMIHEAVGHPFEADSIWKKQSIMTEKMDEIVSKPFVNIYDDATIPNLRGSLSIDDEGTATENVMLVEKGKVVGFLNDKLSAKIMNEKPNGHGRRESYKHMPIPRMNNTMLGQGDTDPEEIIASVKKGFYAVSYQGGQVSNTGKFTFSCNLAYMIENGKLTRPVKNATLIGTNIQILKEISMIGNDSGLFLGSCGKEGQSVPVTCGTPTMKIDKMTVGGAA
ncbi:metallopeptidase TldD-related protein [Bacteroidota bacterium]